ATEPRDADDDIELALLLLGIEAEHVEREMLAREIAVDELCAAGDALLGVIADDRQHRPARPFFRGRGRAVIDPDVEDLSLDLEIRSGESHSGRERDERERHASPPQPSVRSPYPHRSSLDTDFSSVRTRQHGFGDFEPVTHEAGDLFDD